MLPSEMSFEDFASAVKPSGAVNRFPSIGAGANMFSYSVYMNGPMAAQLPLHTREHEFKDVMLHALTEKLGLDSEAARDNLKVAELVALRATWMSAVLESSVDRPAGLSERVTADYEMLSDGLTHPWIVEALSAQRALSSRLQPVLDRAGLVVGATVKDLPPAEVSIGKVVAQDDDFTVQKTASGEVVTHENRRLMAVPALDEDVMVSYYRGNGQVVNSLENMKVSPPFIDPVKGDLAVMLEDGKGVEQIILFNSIAGFDKFVKAHGLDVDFVRQAMDARDASPKAVAAAPERTLASNVYVDESSGCLAVDYKENGVVYSALFRSAEEMATIAQEFGLGARAIAVGRALEAEMVERPRLDARASEAGLRSDLAGMGYDKFQESSVDGRTYHGKIVAVGALHAAQDVGRGVIAIHDLRELDKTATVGDSMTVKFEGGRGKVADMVKAGKDLGR